MLNLTKSEKKAILFVAVILILSILIQWIQPGVYRSEVFDYTMQDSLFKALSADTTTVRTISESVKREIKKEKKNKRKPLRPHQIDINTADEKELILLPGVGQVTAKRIVDYRKEHGLFKTLDELVKVKRIGPKTLEKIKPYIRLGTISVQRDTSN